VATTAGFFSGDQSSPDTLVLRSHVATVMGNDCGDAGISQYGLRLRGRRAGGIVMSATTSTRVHELVVGRDLEEAQLAS
jgi:hypothetical protein